VIVAEAHGEDPDSVELFKRLKSQHQHAVFLLLADRDRFDEALAACDEGIENVVGKPINPKKFRLAFSKALEKLELYSSKRFLRTVILWLIGLIPLALVLSGLWKNF